MKKIKKSKSQKEKEISKIPLKKISTYFKVKFFTSLKGSK